MTRGHTFSMVFLCLVISTGIWLSYTVSVSAFSILEMLGIGTDETEEAAKPTGQKQGKPSAEKPKSLKQGQSNSPQKLKAGLGLSDVRNILSVVDQNKRKKILADENTFNNGGNFEHL